MNFFLVVGVKLKFLNEKYRDNAILGGLFNNSIMDRADW
jgi:hypothetical protein